MNIVQVAAHFAMTRLLTSLLKYPQMQLLAKEKTRAGDNALNLLLWSVKSKEEYRDNKVGIDYAVKFLREAGVESNKGCARAALQNGIDLKAFDRPKSSVVKPTNRNSVRLFSVGTEVSQL